jgi:EAL domain-containing protein (putative c-di-GMP-specific phosphodiesterase class I)
MGRGAGLLIGQIVFPILRNELIIGRTDRGGGIFPDIDITPFGGGREVSRRHAALDHRAGHYFVRDLGSQLGTLVNGGPLGESEHELAEGDTVTLGSVTLRFSLGCEWPEGVVPEWEKGESSLSTSTELPSGLPLIAQLPNALTQGEVVLHYQPQVDLKTGRVPSVEALIRWEHPKMGLVEPARYISLAEDTGFVRVLTTFALKEAVRALNKWKGEGKDLNIAVNLSVLDLEDVAFPDRVVSSMEASNTAAKDFTLEVTETSVMSNPGMAIATLQHLRSLGFGITIDDFGVGQSSLTYVKDLPADELKLDKSFAKSMTSHEKNIVQSAVQMAHALDMTIVAEGVEDEETFRFLREVGCDKAQGYYFGRPAPEEEVDLEPRLLSDQSPPA